MSILCSSSSGGLSARGFSISMSSTVREVSTSTLCFFTTWGVVGGPTFGLRRCRFAGTSLSFGVPDGTRLGVMFGPENVFGRGRTACRLSFSIGIRYGRADARMVYISYMTLFSFRSHVGVSRVPRCFCPGYLTVMFPCVETFMDALSLRTGMEPMILPAIGLVKLARDLGRGAAVMRWVV